MATSKRPEKDLHKDIRELCRAMRIPFVTSQMNKRPTIQRGWPDFTLCYRGRFVAWELKTMSKLTEDQMNCMNFIRQSGGHVAVIHSLGEAQAHLTSIDAKLNSKFL
jgi:hypothetical protein